MEYPANWDRFCMILQDLLHTGTGYGISCKKWEPFLHDMARYLISTTVYDKYHAKTGPVFAGYSITCSDLQNIMQKRDPFLHDIP